MSAWIVTADHIDVLVQAAITEGMIAMELANETGFMLWRENHLSVNYRYRENTPVPEYKFHGIEAPLDPMVVFATAACYDYQTCEHPTYEESLSRLMIVHLQDRMAAKLGTDREGAYKHPRWGSAPWGIDNREQAIAR